MAFQVKSIKQDDMIGLTLGGTTPFEFDIKPRNSALKNDLSIDNNDDQQNDNLTIKIKIRSRKS